MLVVYSCHRCIWLDLTLRNNSREGKDERQIKGPKDVLIAMRKDQSYRETKMRLLHKLSGLDMLEVGYNDESDNDDLIWFKGFHVFSSRNAAMDRLTGGRPLSCFTTSSNGNEKHEVHVAFLDGGRKNHDISYFTFIYDPEQMHVQESGVHFCRFSCKQDATGNALVTTTTRRDLREQVVGYALMLPYIVNRSDAFHQQFTLVYWDWEVLLCNDLRKTKGRAVVEGRVFERILEQIRYSSTA